MAQVVDLIIQKNITNQFKFADGVYQQGIIKRGLGRLWAALNLDELPDGRIIDFVVYQIYRFRDMIEQYPNTKWQTTWLWSDSAVAKFEHQFFGEQAKAGINYYIDQWLKEGQLTRDQLIQMLSTPKEHPLAKYIYIEAEEPTKRRFLNTELGKLNCYRATTGWTPFSKACDECQYCMECMETFSKILPEIIRLRQTTPKL